MLVHLNKDIYNDGNSIKDKNWCSEAGVVRACSSATFRNHS